MTSDQEIRLRCLQLSHDAQPAIQRDTETWLTEAGKLADFVIGETRNRPPKVHSVDPAT